MGKMNFADKKADKDLMNKIAELTVKTDHITLVIWATDCAEHVLSYYEEKYPEDNRPREAIDAGRAWVRGDISINEARAAAFAAHAAARDTDEDGALSVARATGHAAATVHVAGHAIHAANYAAKAIANERAWQYQHLLDLRENS